MKFKSSLKSGKKDSKIKGKEKIKCKNGIINFCEYKNKKKQEEILNCKREKRNKTVKKVVALLLLINIVLSNTIFAVDLSKNSYEQYFGDYRIYSQVGTEKYIKYQGRVQTNYEYYYLDKNGEKMPSYCLNLGVDGAETKDDYYVNVSEKIEDNYLLSLMYSGYPYKDENELGVANITEAKYATQFAIWAYLSNLNLEQITPTIPDYQRVVNAIRKIYDDGIMNPYFYDDSFAAINTLIENDDIDKSYYSSKIKLIGSSYNIKDIKIQVSGVEEYKIVDLNNNPIHDTSNIREFKILVPKDIISETKDIDVNITYGTRQNAILFGASKIPGMQNVSVNLKPVTSKTEQINLTINYFPINFEIIKLDKDNENIKIPNVKFRIYNMQDKLLGEYVTDKNGSISFDILKELKVNEGEKVKVQEIEVPDGYYIDKENDTQIIQVSHLGKNVVTFKNEKIKGKVKIIKSSADFNYFNNFDKGTLLKDAVFEVYDKDNNLIQELITNEKGEAISKELLKGKYYIKEKSSPKNYILDDKIYEVEINEHNQVVTLNLKNSSEKKVELPKTGF